MKTYTGIDIGLHGAIARLSTDGTIVIFDMPTVKARRNDYDLSELTEILRSTDRTNSHIIAEAVHSMPAQSSQGTFSLGRGRGILEGILVALELPYSLVDPAKWKREMGLSGKTKGDSYLLAIQLFPSATTTIKKSQDGRAEALLLAEYARRRNL